MTDFVENFDDEQEDENLLKRKLEEDVIEEQNEGSPSKSRKYGVEIMEEEDEGGGTLWNISKVYLYKPGVKPGSQVFYSANGDPKVQIGEDGCSIENLGGYRSARAAYGITEGSAYFEVEVPVERTGAVRVGWSVERGDPEATVGYDIWGYGVRDLDGSKFNDSRGRSYAGPFNPGDIIGAYIFIPPKPNDEPEPTSPPPDPNKAFPEIVAENDQQWTIRIMPDISYNLPTSEIIPVARKGSKIAYFRNGKFLGIAFSDVWAGTYYASVSPYRTRVKVNFGPKFKYTPSIPDSLPSPIPCSELYGLWFEKFQIEEKERIEKEEREKKEKEEREREGKLLETNSVPSKKKKTKLEKQEWL